MSFNEELHREIGFRIQQRRRIQRISQEELAAMLEVSRSSVANIERGRQKLSVQVLWQISQALRSEFSSLLPEPANLDDQRSKLLESLRETQPKPARDFIATILRNRKTET